MVAAREEATFSAATAWPLPSGATAKAKSSAAGAAKPSRPGPAVVRPAKAGRSSFQARRRPPPLLRRKATRLQIPDNTPPRIEETKSAPKVAAAGPAFTSGNHEAIIAPMKKPASGQPPLHPNLKSNRPTEPPVRPPAVLASDAASLQTAWPAAHGAERASGIDLTAQCVAFHNGEHAVRQLRRARHDPATITYCVHPKALPAFDAALTIARDGLKGDGNWLAPFVVRQRVDIPLRQLAVHKYSGAGQQQRKPDDHPVEQLGSDAVMTVLNVALFKEGPATANIQAPYKLGRNTFRLLSHTDLASHSRLFIAYFVNRDSGPAIGVGAGHLEVFNDAPGRYSVEDAALGYVFSAASINDLIKGLQQVSGCRFISALEGPEEEDTVPTAPSPPAMRAANLYVDRQETLSWTPPHSHLPFNSALEFFDRIAVDLSGHGPECHLYRSSFAIVGGSVAFVDQDGRPGALHLQPTLECGSAHACRFADRLGLRPGRRYAPEQIAQVLQHAGLVPLGNMTRVAPPSTPETVSVPTSESTPVTLSQPLARSVFWFDADRGTLDYVDPTGRSGRLLVHRLDRPRRGYRVMSTPQDAHARRFLQDTGLLAGVTYTEDALLWLLMGAGYAREPEQTSPAPSPA